MALENALFAAILFLRGIFIVFIFGEEVVRIRIHLRARISRLYISDPRFTLPKFMSVHARPIGQQTARGKILARKVMHAFQQVLWTNGKGVHIKENDRVDIAPMKE